MSTVTAYDAAFIFGNGIHKDGLLPESSVACVQKAVELNKNNPLLKLVTCGKWPYQLAYTPPFTEAAALRNTAIELGFPMNSVFAEDKSVTAILDACLAKVEYLEKHQWNRIALIAVQPESLRALYTLKYILGTRYSCHLIPADFTYSPQKRQELEAIEREEVLTVQNLLAPLPLGDHVAIFSAAMAELKASYEPKPF